MPSDGNPIAVNATRPFFWPVFFFFFFLYPDHRGGSAAVKIARGMKSCSCNAMWSGLVFQVTTVPLGTPQSDARTETRSLVSVASPYALDAHRVHAYGALTLVGILFFVSVVTTHFATCMTRMSRKILHAVLQSGATVALYAVAVPVLTLPNDGSMHIHKAFGFALLFGGLPLMFLSRYSSLKKWHVLLGKLVLVALSVQCCLGAWMYGHATLLAFACTSSVLYVMYIVASERVPHPSVSEWIRREADGTYHVVEEQRDVKIVGSGWATFLNKDVVTRREYSVRHLTGRYANGRWGAGTTIAALQGELGRAHQSVASHPSVLGATLGGWIFTHSHGNGGESWSRPFGSIVVYDTHAGRVLTLDSPQKAFRDAKTIEEQRRYIILEVEVKAVEDEQCLQQVFALHAEKDYRRFFGKNVLLRAVFVDANDATCLTWTRTDERTTNRLAYLFPIGLFATKILPHGITRCIPPTIWTRTMSLRQANNFVGFDPPYFTGLFAYLYTNVEVFVTLPLTAKRLKELCEHLQSFFGTQCGGRCEVRYEDARICMDFALLTQNYQPVFQSLEAFFGRGTRVSIHKGKYQVVTHPLPLHQS